MKSKKPIIEANNIKKVFNKHEVLKDISFNLFDGETLAIIGANGAGKTVLMEIIAKIIKKDSGTIKYNFNPKKKSIEEEFGFQFQDSEMPKGGMKTKKIINFFFDLYSDRIKKSELDEMIEIFKVKDFLNKNANKLSGGQKQRLNILLAIMHKPKIMILDEFITGLDIHSSKNIIKYISELKKQEKSTMIIITHQPKELEKLADRVLVINEGTVTNEFTRKQIISKYKDFDNFLEKVI